MTFKKEISFIKSEFDTGYLKTFPFAGCEFVGNLSKIFNKEFVFKDKRVDALIKECSTMYKDQNGDQEKIIHKESELEQSYIGFSSELYKDFDNDPELYLYSVEDFTVYHDGNISVKNSDFGISLDRFNDIGKVLKDYTAKFYFTGDYLAVVYLYNGVYAFYGMFLTTPMDSQTSLDI